jgi:hypothetical protein
LPGNLSEIADTVREQGYTHLLIEEDLKGPGLDLVEIFGVVTRSKTPWKVRKIAFVDLNPEHHSSRLQFAETAAFSRGFPLRIFRSVDEARTWLADS